MLTRRDALTRIGAVLAGAWLLDGVAPARAAAPVAVGGWTDAGYWAFADRCQARLDELWSDRAGHYAGGGASETSLNASLLFTHAAAALAGHAGPARNDERARALAGRLCAAPPWVPVSPAPPGPADQAHEWGWGNTMASQARQHVAIDALVVRGLAHAWLARGPLQLPETTVAAIADAIRRCAASAFYAYPALRLNQINWPIEIHAWAALLFGDTRLLHHDCRLQLGRFADALTAVVPPFRIPFTGPGYRFHYVPTDRAVGRANYDSPEYASIVCGALQFSGPARRAGMDALRPTQLAALRAWVERVLCGYWTHGGYLSWDTGASFRRWHQGKKLALAQAALQAIASAPEFQRTPAHGRWAKWIFDRGLELFDRLTHGSAELPAAVPFGITETLTHFGDDQLFAARMQANAARAVTLGLGALPSEMPPPLYAYDPDVGRLAVTTPVYNTAVAVVDYGRLPYGGAELARLYDGDQRVAAGIGGRPPAAFGVVLREHATGRSVESQRGRHDADLERPPLRLERAPRGAVRRPRPYPRRPYAGRFTKTLVATADTRTRAALITTRHRFAADHVETRWRVEPRRPRGRYSVDILFPSWGAGATVTAVLEGGARERLGSSDRRLGDVRWLYVAGEESGYVIVPVFPPPARIRLLATSPQDSAPRPGPTLAIALLDHARLRRRLRLVVRIAPAATFPEARRVAARLR